MKGVRCRREKRRASGGMVADSQMEPWFGLGEEDGAPQHIETGRAIQQCSWKTKGRGATQRVTMGGSGNSSESRHHHCAAHHSAFLAAAACACCSASIRLAKTRKYHEAPFLRRSKWASERMGRRERAICSVRKPRRRRRPAAAAARRATHQVAHSSTPHRMLVCTQ